MAKSNGQGEKNRGRGKGKGKGICFTWHEIKGSERRMDWKGRWMEEGRAGSSGQRGRCRGNKNEKKSGLETSQAMR